ncbi:heme ABC transporter ATP-binding protein [Vibrio nigripulchritudo]|uniref:heme ABC transporter ATP-binding protein n=1 Tax=Vibrio nigripulchritudo TaxID=28173 RepID=UPI0024913834|nr:heme ABC transporter ATP-binding protein [Vibrio nigripulchritudo]BDU36595.1 hemin import ATP-binding protein HmuV [Vibrio nigripulchritudo]BDU42304.1 hemin import ATP-binding protein HmuV [Vibrio nigripulchritudo]
MTTPVISAKNLNLSFGNRKIIDDLSIDIYAGQVTALMGSNGAGKSSLLKILNGEIPSESDVYYLNKSRTEWDKTELAKYVGMLPQQSTLSFPFLAQEVVELGAMPLALPNSEIKPLASEMMRKVDVSDLANRLYPSLSGGEKQRVHLARVLLQISSSDNKILMLDEPTSALDLAHQHSTLALARELAAEGAAVIVVLHDLNLAAQYSDRMIFLNNGKIVEDDSPWEALNSQLIEDVYGFKTFIEKHPKHQYPVVYPD